jgi:hypothetical protein
LSSDLKLSIATKAPLKVCAMSHLPTRFGIFEIGSGKIRRAPDIVYGALQN